MSAFPALQADFPVGTGATVSGASVRDFGALRYLHSCWPGGAIPVWRRSRDGRFSAGKFTGKCCVAVTFGITLRHVVMGAGC